MKKKTCWIGLLFVLPCLLGTLLFTVFPLLWSAAGLFSKGLSPLEDLLSSAAFQLAMRNTLIFLLESIPLLLALGILLGMGLAEQLPSSRRHGTSWFPWALLFPLALPTASALLGWQALLGEGGWFLRFLNAWGCFPLSPQEAFPREWLAFLFVQKHMGLFAVMLAGSFRSLPGEYRDVFRLDSSSVPGYFLRVALPSVRGTIYFALVLSLALSFQIFREAYGLYGDHPPQEAYLLQHFIQNNFYKLNEQRLTASAFLLLLGFAVVLVPLLRRQEKQEDML